jgi:hypothetical protein
MQTVNRQIITIDLKKPSLIQLPQFIQGDTNILEIIIKEDGVDADLNNIGRIVASYRRPDGEEFSRLLTSTDNIVVYKLGVEENEVKGYGEVDVKFFSSDNLERISTKRFKVSLAESIGTGTIYENNGELTLLQELFVEVESIKQSAENEDARIENESQRQDAEAERNSKEIERQLTETSRIEAESTRLTSEQTRETNEAIRQQQEAARQNNTSQIISEAQQAILNTEIVTQYATESGEYAVGKGNEAQALGLYAKQQGDRAQQIVDENKTIWLKPVATFAAIATTYPNPVFGSKVITMDDQKEYRFTTFWEWTGIYSSNGVTALQAQLADANRQSQVLTHGTSIFASALNSPVEFEVQGRTLISLGNSNLEGGKLYVLADKRTKIRAEGREGTLLNGVAKFTKSASLISKADYVGKVSGSVTENPHIAKATGNSVFQTPTGSWAESTQQRYDQITTLNGTISNYGFTSVSGAFAQQLFSFNIIEQIERKLGRIPADTVAGKVAWIKENVNKLTANWHGFGSSVGGNKASFSVWDGVKWNSVSHSSNTIAKLTHAFTSMLSAVREDGFVHYLAYAEPSDGTTPSQLNTDFIELEIELKTTAVLDTRPIITRVANFEGKVSGSVVENPHLVNWNAAISLLSPLNNQSAFGGNPPQSSIDMFKTLDNISVPVGYTGDGRISQTVFSFNLIEEVERNIGRIPKATVAEKVQWLKDNVELLFEWYGFGSSVGGNRASIKRYNVTTSTWDGGEYHTSSTTFKRFYSLINLTNNIDTNGFAHFLAYAEPSNGVISSMIYTDYVELQISLKQGTTLHDPVLPLYEVDATEYANILVTWDEANVLNRYPKVQGVQHLQNLAVIAEGENLLPPFSEWTLHANAVIKSPYELELNANGAFQGSFVELRVVGGQVCTISGSVDPNKYYAVTKIDSNNVQVGAKLYLESGATSMVFNLENNVVKLKVESQNKVVGKFTFTNPILTLGSTPRPFVPRNPSYLFAPVKLGQIGTTKDSLFKSDGQWQLVERVKKDVVLDGSLAWSYHGDGTGNKIYKVTFSGGTPLSENVLKFNGLKLLHLTASLTDKIDCVNYDGSTLWINVSDIDTGFGETYAPTSDEIKAYFNGWQAKTIDANGKPTAWRSLGNGTDAPTQTLAYVKDNKAPNFTPYKLSYVLAAPQTQNVNHLVEGDIAVSGPTQVEVTSGVVVREKVVPTQHSSNLNRYINEKDFSGLITDNPLKSRTDKIISVYKNGQKDSSWFIYTDVNNKNGIALARLDNALYDPTAEYTVTYLVLDRHLFTVNATEVKVNFAGNFKEVQDMQVEKVSDLAAQQNVLANQMYRVLVAAKGAGWNV